VCPRWLRRVECRLSIETGVPSKEHARRFIHAGAN
jgi:hypothetical protein